MVQMLKLKGKDFQAISLMTGDEPRVKGGKRADTSKIPELRVARPDVEKMLNKGGAEYTFDEVKREINITHKGQKTVIKYG